MKSAPKIIDDLSFPKILNEKLDRLTAEYQKEVPAFERPTQADPSYRTISELTLSEVIIREKINASGLSLLLRYSKELDFVLFGMRRENESDDAYRERIRLNINFASPAGTLEMYRSLALACANEGAKDPKEFLILDAYAERVDDRIIVHLQPNLEVSLDASASIAKVTAFLNLEWIKPGLDEVEVVQATGRTINVQAVIDLESGKGLGLLQELEKFFRSNWAEKSRLGWGPAASWIFTALNIDGVASVELKTPIGNAKLSKTEYAVLGRLQLSLEEPNA